jgi:hypothetical protein
MSAAADALRAGRGVRHTEVALFASGARPAILASRSRGPAAEQRGDGLADPGADADTFVINAGLTPTRCSPLARC